MLAEFSIISTCFLILFFAIDVATKRDFSLFFVLSSNPYASALIILAKVLQRTLPALRLRLLAIACFLLTILVTLSVYYWSTIGARTVVQYVQFILLLLVILVSLASTNNHNHNVDSLVKGIAGSALLLSLCKIFDAIFFEGDFKVNGLNEDAFLLSISGLISGMLLFQKFTFRSLVYFGTILGAVYVYESRAALVIGSSSLVLFALGTGRFKRKAAIMLLSVAAFFYYEFASFFVELIDVSRNFSNIERLAMYAYTLNFMVSEASPYGVGNVGVAMQDMYNQGVTTLLYPHPHSTYLRFMLELKWISVAMLTLFGVSTFALAKKIERTNPRCYIIYWISIFCLVCFCFVDSVFYSFYRGILFLFILFLIVNSTAQPKKPEMPQT